MAPRRPSGRKRHPAFRLSGWLPAALAGTWAILAAGLALRFVPAWLGTAAGMFEAWAGGGDFRWGAAAGAAAVHFAWLAVPVLVLAGAYGAGWGPARLLGLPGGGWRAFLQAALGMGAATMIVQGLGLTGLLRGWVPPAAAAALAGGGVAALVRFRPGRRIRPVTRGNAAPVLLVAAVLAAGFMLARLPDTHEDARVYHFAAPENYLLIGKVAAEPRHSLWHMPLGAEMDYMLAMALGGTAAAKQVNVAALAVLLALAWRLGVLAGGSARAGPWAAAWTGTTGLVLNLVWQGKNDIMLAMYVAGAAVCLAEGLAGTRAWLARAGWLAGCALGVKFTGGLAVAGLAAAYLLRAGRSFRARPALPAAGIGAVPLAGWLLSSFLFLGNPFHPFLSGIFPELGWSPFYQGVLDAQARAISPPEALLPSDWFGGCWRAWGAPDQGSAALLWLLPLALLGGGGQGAGGLLRTAAALSYLLWMPSQRIARFLFPLVPLLAALAGEGIAGRRAAQGLLSGWTVQWRRTAAAASAAIFFLGGVPYVSSRGWLNLLGQVSDSDLLADRFSTWEGMRRWVNANVPSRGRVLLTGEERRLWFSRRVVSTGPVAEPPFWRLTRESRGPGEVRKRVRQAGFTHLVHNFISAEYRQLLWSSGPEWDSRQLRLFLDFMALYARPVRGTERLDLENGAFEVFEFARRPGAYPVDFLPGTEGRMRRAIGLMRGGDADAALAEAERVLAPVRACRHARFGVAMLMSGSGRPADAFGLLEPDALAGFVDNGNLTYLAAAASKLGRHDGAVRWFARAHNLQRDPVTLRYFRVALVRRARARIAGGDGGGALRDLEAAALLEPTDPAGWYEMARGLEKAGRRGEALARVKRALALDPHNARLAAYAAGLEGEGR